MKNITTDFRYFGKQFLIDFIAIYKNNPCLWKISCIDYTNRHMRDAAYDQLVAKWNQYEEGATREMIKTKINSMRACFRKEVKKVRSARNKGLEYTPTLWYYDQLHFLIPQTVRNTRNPGKSQENYSEGVSRSSNEQDSLLGDGEQTEELNYQQDESHADEESFLHNPMIKMESEDEQERYPFPSASTTPTIIIDPTNTKRNSDNEEFPAGDVSEETNCAFEENSRYNFTNKKSRTIVKFIESDKNDKFDMIAKNYAYKLRKLPQEAFIMTDKLITDILCEAMLRNITRHSRMEILSLKGGQCSSSSYPNSSHVET